MLPSFPAKPSSSVFRMTVRVRPWALNIPCPSTPTTMPTTNVNPSTNTVRLITPPRVRVCTLRTTRRDHLEAREVLPRGRLPHRDRPNAIYLELGDLFAQFRISGLSEQKASGGGLSFVTLQRVSR